MSEKTVTRRQQDTLRVIKNYIEENEIAPTVSEIAEGLNISSKGVVHRNLKALEDANLIHLIPGCKRNIVLVDQPISGGGEIPLLGKIAAGQPVEAINNPETVDLNVLTGPDRYALRVCGSSMIEEGIFDGDLVICEHRNTARNGEIVVALIDNECVTLKRFQRNKDNTVTLIPANKDYLPMTYPANRVAIQGVFVGLVRFHQ